MRVPLLSLLLVLCLAATATSGEEPESRAAIQLTIVDSESRLTITGVQVTIDPAGEYSSDPDGRVVLPHPLPPATTLILQHERYHTLQVKDIVVPSGYTSHLQLSLTPRSKDLLVTVTFDGRYNRTLPALATVRQDSVVMAEHMNPSVEKIGDTVQQVAPSEVPPAPVVQCEGIGQLSEIEFDENSQLKFVPTYYLYFSRMWDSRYLTAENWHDSSGRPYSEKRLEDLLWIVDIVLGDCVSSAPREIRTNLANHFKYELRRFAEEFVSRP